MKTELSAGGIVVYNQAGIWYVILMKDLKGTWTFPKGIIEPKETPQVAARREIYEEVGIGDITMVKKLGSVHYFFKRGELVSKTVHYFLFQSIKKSILKPQKEEGVSEAKWFMFADALLTIGYPKTNKLLLEKAQRFFHKSKF